MAGAGTLASHATSRFQSADSPLVPAAQLGVRLSLDGGALVVGSRELAGTAAELRVGYCL